MEITEGVVAAGISRGELCLATVLEELFAMNYPFHGVGYDLCKSQENCNPPVAYMRALETLGQQLTGAAIRLEFSNGRRAS